MRIKDAIASLTKRAAYRVPWWIFSIFTLWFLWGRWAWWGLVLWLPVFIVIDERLKEGYYIKLSDFRKPLTHENLLAVLTTLAALMGLIFGRKKRRDG